MSWEPAGPLWERQVDTKGNGVGCKVSWLKHHLSLPRTRSDSFQPLQVCGWALPAGEPPTGARCDPSVLAFSMWGSVVPNHSTAGLTDSPKSSQDVETTRHWDPQPFHWGGEGGREQHLPGHR